MSTALEDEDTKTSLLKSFTTEDTEDAEARPRRLTVKRVH
jgi:hypothetical protein